MQASVVLDQNADLSGVGPECRPQWCWTRMQASVVLEDQNAGLSGVGPECRPQWQWMGMQTSLKIFQGAGLSGNGLR